MRLRWIALIIVIIALIGCAREPRPAQTPSPTPTSRLATTTPTRTLITSPTPTITTLPPPPTVLPATVIPTPPRLPTPLPELRPTEDEAVQLSASAIIGQPFWLGRGRIVAGSFLPRRTEIAIGWGLGVSVAKIEDAAERWYTATPLPIVDLTVRPDGEVIAALLRDTSIALLDTDTGAMQLFPGPDDRDVYWGEIVWSPDGEQIAFQGVGRVEDSIWLFIPHHALLKPLPEILFSSTQQPHLSWSPDGTLFVPVFTSEGGYCVVLRDASTGVVAVSTSLRNLSDGPLTRCPHHLGWRPNSREIVVEGFGLIDVESGEVTIPLETPFAQPNTLYDPAVAFDDSGVWVATRTLPDDTPIAEAWLGVWNLEGSDSSPTYVLQDEPDRETVAMRFDGADIIRLHSDGALTRWTPGDPDSVTLGQLPLQEATPHWHWSPDSRLIVSQDARGSISVWDVTGKHRVVGYDPSILAAKLNADSSLIALTDVETRKLIIARFPSGEEIIRLPDPVLTTDPNIPLSNTVDFAPEGDLIAYASGNLILIADVMSGERLATLNLPPDHAVIHVVWTPHADALVTAVVTLRDPLRYQGETILWRREDDAYVAAARIPSDRVWKPDWTQVASFNSRGDRVMIPAVNVADPALDGADNHWVHIFDLSEWDLIASFADTQPMAWLADDTLLTFSWRQGGGWPTMEAHNFREGTVEEKRFTDLPDGAFLPRTEFVIQPDLTTLELGTWDGDRFGVVRTYAINSTTLIASPDGRWVAWLGDNGLLQVWPVHLPQHSRSEN